MTLYDKIKQYTEQGKLVVTEYKTGSFYIYNDKYCAYHVNIKKAFEKLKNTPISYDRDSGYTHETLLGFYNPDTGEVAPYEFTLIDPTREESLDVSDESVKVRELGEMAYKVRPSHLKAMKDGASFDTSNKPPQLIPNANPNCKLYYYKGFNPETLEFDGRKIEEGDKVLVHDKEEASVISVINKDITLPLSTVQSKPVRIEGMGSVTINYPPTGFNPEKLTFDGVEIMEGDKVCLGGHHTEYTVSNVYTINYHEHVTGDEAYIDLVNLNITAHYPKQSEVEMLEKEMQSIITCLSTAPAMIDDEYFVENELDRYYQARKKLEELKSKDD